MATQDSNFNLAEFENLILPLGFKSYDDDLDPCITSFYMPLAQNFELWIDCPRDGEDGSIRLYVSQRCANDFRSATLFPYGSDTYLMAYRSKRWRDNILKKITLLMTFIVEAPICKNCGAICQPNEDCGNWYWHCRSEDPNCVSMGELEVDDWQSAAETDPRGFDELSRALALKGTTPPDPPEEDLVQPSVYARTLDESLFSGALAELSDNDQQTIELMFGDTKQVEEEELISLGADYISPEKEAELDQLMEDLLAKEREESIPVHRVAKEIYGFPLNDNQVKAVEQGDGPVQLIATAGAGKTRVVILRAAYLIREKKVKPWRILLITFSRRAADELRKRLASLIGESQAKLVKITTFHSYCWDQLKKVCNNPRYKNLLGSEDVASYPTAVKMGRLRRPGDIVRVILTSGRLAQWNKDLRAELPICDEDGNEVILCEGLNLKDPDTRVFVSAIHLLHANCINPNDPEDVIREAVSRLQNDDVTKYIPYVYKAYEYAKIRLGVIGFEDMITLYRKEIVGKPARLKQQQELWDHIITDEGQDDSLAQLLIAKALSRSGGKTDGPIGNLMIVGDTGQTVFAFTGAKPQIFNNFHSEDKARQICLNINYRSSRVVVQMGQRLCDLNPNQVHYKVGWVRPEEDCIKPTVEMFQDPTQEAEAVAERIFEAAHSSQDPDNYPYRNHAILMRTNAQSGPMSISLLSRGIPYSSPRSVNFFEQQIVKQCLALLRAINDHQNGRWVSGNDIGEICKLVKWGLGPAFVGPISNWRGCALLGCEQKAGERHGRHRRAADIAMLIRNAAFNPHGKRNTLQQAWIEVENAIMRDAMKQAKLTDADSAEDESLGIMSQVVQNFRWTEISKFLEIAAKAQSASIDDDEKTQKNAVTVSTCHRIKGAEFEDVSIIGCASNLFPHYRALESCEGMEEERRLFYVAVTRSMKYLHFSWPRVYQNKPRHHSQFLEEALAAGEGKEELDLIVNPTSQLNRTLDPQQSQG